MLDFNIPFLKCLILKLEHITQDDRNLFLGVEKVKYYKGRTLKSSNIEKLNIKKDRTRKIEQSVPFSYSRIGTWLMKQLFR
jgi:hypothetical protein